MSQRRGRGFSFLLKKKVLLTAWRTAENKSEDAKEKQGPMSHLWWLKSFIAPSYQVVPE